MASSSRIDAVSPLRSLVILLTVLPVVGCTMGPIALSGAAPNTDSSSGTIQGKAFGGNQPIQGATIQLYAAGAPAMPGSGSATGAYGSGATALIAAGSMTDTSTNNYFPGGAPGCTYLAAGSNPNGCTALPQTDGSGNFTITGDYSCTAGQSVYIVATGGNPGLTTGTNNTAIALMAGLGTCPSGGSLSPTMFVTINEVTTVATVWALQQFMGAPTGNAASAYTSQGGGTAGMGVNIGAPSGPVGGYGGLQTAIIGMQNGFLMVPNLANIGTGLSTSAPTITFSGGGATTNAVVYPIVTAGVITGATVANGGAGYTSAPTVVIYGTEATQATATASYSGGAVTGLTITNGGAGYITPSASYPTPEVGKINYIANILSDCINSLSNTSTGCSGLLTGATPSGKTTAADTIQAAYYMATNPLNNVSTLNGLETPQASFAPVTTPTDYTIAVGFSPTYAISGTAYPAMNSPYALTVDGYGDVWVGNTNMPSSPPTFSTAAGSVTELAPDGSVLMGPVFNYASASSGVSVTSPSAGPYIFPTSGANSFESIAVDTNNNVWVPNSRQVTTATSPSTIASAVEFTSSSRSSATNLNSASTGVQNAYWLPTNPYGIAVDGNDNVFVSNSTNYAYEFANAGSAVVQSNAKASSWTQATAMDTRGYLWVVAAHACQISTLYGGAIYQYLTTSGTPTLTATGTITSKTPGGVAEATQCGAGSTNPVTPTLQINATTSTPLGVAVDHNNNLWIANAVSTGGVTFIGVNSDGTIGTTSSSSLTVNTGGVSTPSAVAIDGNNNAWIADNSGNNLVAFSATTSTSGTNPVVTSVSAITPITGSAGYSHNVTGAKISSPKAIAVDPTGNVWLTNNGTSNYVTAIIGVAAPTVTPIAVALKNNVVGVLP